MFCYQCEQTAGGTGCEVQGVCGKSPEISALIDTLMYATKGLSEYAFHARKVGVKDPEADRFVLKTLFTTVTNVNFDPERYHKLLKQFVALRDEIKIKYEKACSAKGIKPEVLSDAAAFVPATDSKDIEKQAANLAITERFKTYGKEITGLQELITYGLKGMAAYAYHAYILGKEDDEVYEFIHEALNYLANGKPDTNKLLTMALECGRVNLKALALLDEANTGSYGHPVPTSVRVEPVKGKAILVSGHDLKDLEELLKQTEGKGINIYTHGEMLPAHGYPKLKKYKHLVGNYGSAWQNQQKEFPQFPGPILMTTNCLQRPAASYKDRIFTSGTVGWSGAVHIANHDYAPLIKTALLAEGFTSDGEDKSITVGFGHHAVFGVADKIISAVKKGSIKHFFLIGGCDGAKPGRNYYTEFAESVPKDSLIITLACGKYRFNKLDFGDIDGIPRLIDCGQCNDAYSAIQIASALAKAMNCTVNELPLSFILSWYEQKAVCILLTLLHLGIKNMRLGPSLPAFITPNILNVLVEKFDIKPISTAGADIKFILGQN